LTCIPVTVRHHTKWKEDETEILSYAIPLFCSIGADVRQSLTRG
jgi:hypothetical protein